MPEPTFTEGQRVWHKGRGQFGTYVREDSAPGVSVVDFPDGDRARITTAMLEPATMYAWCFSHGRLHTFRSSREYLDGAWCTALWVHIDADTEESAEQAKERMYGDAQFIDQLGLEVQVHIHSLASARHKGATA